LRKNSAVRFIAPAEVQNKKLKLRLRGYSRAEVEKLLQEVVASYAHVWRERDQLQTRVEQLEKDLAPLQEAERLLRGSLVNAQRAGTQIRAQAALDAEELLKKARARTKGTQAEAKAETVRLENEVERLEMVKRELNASIRAVLLAGLELLEDPSPTKPRPVAELQPPINKTADPATA
jgi:DivIVA domain-containing protein